MNRIKQHKWLLTSVMLVAVVLLALFGPIGVQFNSPPESVSHPTLEIGQYQMVFSIGPREAQAAVDYTCDGIDDDVQFQQAINDLPSVGGKIVVLAGDYSFTNTVSRAIDNVTFQGVGMSTSISRAASATCIDAGVQSDWVFRDLKFTATALDVTTATNWTKQNVAEGAVFYAYQVDLSVTADEWAIPIGRSSTLTVASSNATAPERAQADFLCDGTDDWGIVETAITASNGGIVQLSSGTFYFDQGEICQINDCTVKGQGSYYRSPASGTIINLAGNTDGVQVMDKGKLWGVTIDSPTNFSGIALLVAPEVTVGGNIIDQQLLVLYDISVVGDTTNKTGTGLKLETDSSSSENFIELSTFSQINIAGYSKGFHIYNNETTNNAFINGNIFDTFIIHRCEYPIYLECVAEELNGNIFNNFIVNGCTGMVDVISFVSTSSGDLNFNIFNNFILWDYSAISGKPINFGSVGSSHVIHNYLHGYFGYENASQCYSGSDFRRNFIHETAAPSYAIRPYPPGTGFSGLYIFEQVGENVTAGQVCYRSTSKWWLADADAEATADSVLGLAMNTVNADGYATFLLHGTVNFAGWGLTNGSILYLSTTAGSVTSTPPSGAGDIIRVVGETFTWGEIIMFYPSPDWYEHDGTGINKINGIAINP